MRRVLALLAVLLLPLLCARCISAFDPDLDAPPKRLVVDGLVTDDAGPHTVRLTYSAAFEQSLEGRTETVTGATVTIEDDAGNRVALDDAGAGFYRTAPGALVGRVGRRYTLTVELPDGRVYQSRPARMPPVPPVDSVSVELGRRPPMQTGVRVLTDAKDPADTTNRYRWTWSAVYETEIQISGQPLTKRCWVNDSPRSQRLATLSLLKDTFIDGNRIEDQPVVFLPFNQKFLFGYSLAVEQLSLTREAYEFWHQIELQLEQSGSLFDPPPSRIRGNVVNVADTTDRALGYFGASAAAKKRTCISVRDFPSAPFIDFVRKTGTSCDIVNGRPSPPDFWTCSETTGS